MVTTAVWYDWSKVMTGMRKAMDDVIVAHEPNEILRGRSCLPCGSETSSAVTTT